MQREGRREGMSRRLQEIRCRKCNRLLMKGEVGVIEIKCPKCGYVQRIEEGDEKRGSAGTTEAIVK